MKAKSTHMESNLEKETRLETEFALVKKEIATFKEDKALLWGKATQEQLDTAQEIMKRLTEASFFTYENGETITVETNGAYLDEKQRVDLSKLHDDPEQNAGFINVNNCEYYLHFEALINSEINGDKITFLKDRNPTKHKKAEYLYLQEDLIIIVK